MLRAGSANCLQILILFLTACPWQFPSSQHLSMHQIDHGGIEDKTRAAQTGDPEPSHHQAKQEIWTLDHRLENARP